MQAWLGTTAAGLRIKLKGEEDAWNSPIELPDDTATMTNLAWGSCTTDGIECGSIYNKVCCSGVANVTQQTPASNVVFAARTGPLQVAQGKSMVFMADLLITPNKAVNLSQHFTTRYYHFGGEFPPHNMSMAEAAAVVQAQNATWINIHQGSNLNLYIDYPLRSDLPGGDRLADMVAACHALDLHVKLYFTTRELTNRCSELFLLKGLPDHEVLFGGSGGGGAWLQEHLSSDYDTAWSQPSAARHDPGSPSLNGISILGDEAVHDSGYSRWNNFYVRAIFPVCELETFGCYTSCARWHRLKRQHIRWRHGQKATDCIL